MSSAQSVITQATRVVIKVGSSLVTNEGHGLDNHALARWAAEIAVLRQMGKQVVLVSSGAIAEGIQRLGWSSRPSALNALQAAAAVGQMGLAQAYEVAFSCHQITTAQVLLTHEDLADRTRYLNARSTLLTLLELGVVPIINENDTVVTAEIKFGDNDTLAALVTNLIDADALIILTDQRGLYDSDPRKNPHAVFIQEAIAGTIALEQMAGGAGSNIGTGGMLTKIIAAKRAARSGAHTLIANGREANVLQRLAQGEIVGTQLVAQTTPLAARKQWVADHIQVSGSLILDNGAVQALKNHKSLLAVGVIACRGDFQRGEIVACLDETGHEWARGLVNYNSTDTQKILGQPSQQIAHILGYVDAVDLINRDNLVVWSI